MAKIGAARLALIGGIAIAALVSLAYFRLGADSGPMAYLFTDLEPSAAQSIADKLSAEKVPYQISPDGTAIMAPQSRLAELRMSLAGDRLGGKVGYEVLDQQQPFGVAASRARLDETRAIEGELARSVRTLDHVQGARVHIVMPETSLFSTERRRATAAVTVKTSSRLSGENVQAIRYLVASSVPELAPDSVSVIDQTGALLARSGDPDAINAADADERQQQVEAKLRQQVESLLEPIVGVGKVRAEVAAQIDRDQTREEATVVDPDKQAIAHQVSVESNDQDSQTSGSVGGPASISTQLPENPKAGASAAGGDGSQSKKAETSEDTTCDPEKAQFTTFVNWQIRGELQGLRFRLMTDQRPSAKKVEATTVSLHSVALGTEGEETTLEALIVDEEALERVEAGASAHLATKAATALVDGYISRNREAAVQALRRQLPKRVLARLRSDGPRLKSAMLGLDPADLERIDRKLERDRHILLNRVFGNLEDEFDLSISREQVRQTVRRAARQIAELAGSEPRFRVMAELAGPQFAGHAAHAEAETVTTRPPVIEGIRRPAPALSLVSSSPFPRPRLAA
ncbi:flagellar basal-body MS-ring/collar protein FliF [Sphingomonas ginkgonis]|uniref:flagellar basal-body MS-ring/collar protein FliF n=1 Tax=Sphingomonas ginkgonis TaxID=2315330 RepID=UPI001EF121EA|nr:flagellar basal-body MS-ring/collar protein FliF [Sphingomonas ginkgonis]